MNRKRKLDELLSTDAKEELDPKESVSGVDAADVLNPMESAFVLPGVVSLNTESASSIDIDNGEFVVIRMIFHGVFLIYDFPCFAARCIY